MTRRDIAALLLVTTPALVAFFTILALILGPAEPKPPTELSKFSHYLDQRRAQAPYPVRERSYPDSPFAISIEGTRVKVYILNADGTGRLYIADTDSGKLEECPGPKDMNSCS